LTGVNSRRRTISKPPPDAERAAIVADIVTSIASGRAPDEHAVLCATHVQASQIAAALTAAGLPASYLGDIFMRPEVKDMLALLELCCGRDGAPLLRLARWPAYKVEPACVEALVREACAQGLAFPAALTAARSPKPLLPVEEEALSLLAAHIEAARYYPQPADILLRYLFGEASYLRALLTGDPAGAAQAAAALFGLVVLARGFAARPVLKPAVNLTQAFLHYVRRLMLDGTSAASLPVAVIPGAVQVMTIHSSKGLEFPVVYVPNLGRGRFPGRGRPRATIALPPELRPSTTFARDDERRLFFVAISRAKEHLVLSRAASYDRRGHRSNPAPVLELLAGAPEVEAVEWPVCEAQASLEDNNLELDAASPLPDAAKSEDMILTARELESLVRCPHRHYLADELGLTGSDGGTGYGLFSALLREGVDWLRDLRASGTWPASWDAAAAVLTSRWDARWPIDLALGPYYRDKALRVYRAEYDRLTGLLLTGPQRGRQRHIVVVEGVSVAVEVDLVDERDGCVRLARERPSPSSSDGDSLTVGLYGAVSTSAFPGRETAIEIRYHDGAEPRAITNATGVLGAYKPRIRAVMAQVRAGRYPPWPRSNDECLHCPFLSECPGPEHGNRLDEE
jgi:hypothetical protein